MGYLTLTFGSLNFLNCDTEIKNNSPFLTGLIGGLNNIMHFAQIQWCIISTRSTPGSPTTPTIVCAT